NGSIFFILLGVFLTAGLRLEMLVKFWGVFVGFFFLNIMYWCGVFAGGGWDTPAKKPLGGLRKPPPDKKNGTEG
ncbi:hypothetical protein, partial [Enterobacter hormaechei]